ncbi:unnamed protein product [Sphagnum jensenii]|uniref:histidine kinase n=1 Tax=Sphagnum jensenii TaxID=128206 RepID=A0ABP1AAN9_9BRYO
MVSMAMEKEEEEEEEVKRKKRVLPINQYEGPILDAIANNTVVVIMGDTGSGKCTQLAQILYRAGYTANDIVVVTHPRRVAAVSVARELVSTSSTDSSKSEMMPQYLASVVEKGGNPTPYFFPALHKSSNGFAGGVGLASSKSPKDSTRGHIVASILNMSPGVYDSSSKATQNSEKHGSGSAASVLGIPPGYAGGSKSISNQWEKKQLENFLDLPHSVLQMVATALQCDVVVAGLLHNPMRLHETVLCVPRGMITVPVRLSKGLLAASTCEVVDTEGLLLPSMVTAALGSRPKRYLATVFSAEGYEGLCYALWLDPAKVPDVAQCTMQDAGQSLPLLLANRVRSLCCDRMGRRFDSIMKRMPQAVVFVDDGRAPCLVNTSAAKLLGLPKAGDVDPIQVAEGMKRLADRSKCRANTYRCFNLLAGDPTQKQEWAWELRDPRCVLRVRSYPISNVATHGRVWLFDDVTAKRDAHDAIEAADKAKSNFLAMMSHELRTPMTGVLGMLDLLLLTMLTPEQAGYVRVMQGSAEGLMQVLNEILDFSKIQSGHLALDIVDFHIGEVLDQVSNLFQGRLQEKRLSLDVIKPPIEEMAVRGDPNRLRQVLTNLVSNAIKFTERGGVTISWQQATDGRIWFEVRITDTGIGLTQEQQGRLFQSFSQADSSTTRKFGGTGLGLAICKGVVAVMGGAIWVESEAGKGSTFAFCVPLRPTLNPAKYFPEPDVPSPHKVKSVRTKGQSLLVLVAEDNTVNQLLIRKMLKHYGHEVELVANGQLAVEAIQTGHHDMILMDLQMPVLDGLSATKAIRALGGCASSVPIYALTADVLTKGRETLEAMGLDGYLTKPINWESLSQVINKVMNGKRGSPRAVRESNM